MAQHKSYSPDQFNRVFELAEIKPVINQHTGVNEMQVVGQDKLIHFFSKKRSIDQQYQLRGIGLEDTQTWVIRHNQIVQDYQYLLVGDDQFKIIDNSVDDGNYYEKYDFLTVKKLKGGVVNG